MPDSSTRQSAILQKRSGGRVSRPELVVVLLLLTLSMGLRLTGLQRFIANDEIRWTCRSIQFREALRQRDWAGTFRVGHPGVVTTWLGAAFIPRGQAQAENSCRVSKGGMELDRVATTSEERTRHIAELGQLLFNGRVGVPLFTSLCITVVYILMRLNFGPRVAVLGLILIALDPFFLALSRVLHVDAVLTGLMAVSLLGTLAALRHSGSRIGYLGLLALSGTATGLAMLQKSPAAFLVPWTALLLTAHACREGMDRQALLRVGRDLAFWGLVLIIVYMAVWPAMWSNPLNTVRKVAEKAVGYAEEGHEPGNYFLGQPVQEPGWGYYPVAVTFRLSPLVLIGLIASLIWLVQGREPVRHRFGVAAPLLYSVLFGAFMSLGAKKFDRYLLPIFPALEIVAATGLLGLVQVADTRLRDLLPRPLSIYPIAYLIVLVIQLSLVLPHYPHYLTYYNPLLGGLRQAKDALVVGWGEGYEKAAAYLNARPNAPELQVAVPTFTAFAPLFSGETLSISNYSASQTDYVVFYLSQVQREHDQTLMEQYFSNPRAEPEYIVTLHEVDYAWIYPNLNYVQPMSYLREHGQPDRDALITNGDSVFGKHYRGKLQVHEFHSRSSPQEIAGLLDDLPASAQRIWYARYPETDPDAASRLLKNRGLLVEKREFPDLELVLYRLVDEQPAPESLDLQFGDLRLSGYTPTRPPAAWRRDGGFLLQWESNKVLQNDYTAFVHLYDSTGHRIAQGDSPIVNRDLLPTSQWQPGTSGTTLHHLSIPVGTPPGRYDLEVGVYDLETGERLPLLNAEGEQQGTSAHLQGEVGVPDQIPDPNDLVIAQPSEHEIDPGLKLLGYDLEHQAVPAGEKIPLTLFWQALDSPRQDYRLQLGLLDHGRNVLEQRELSLVSTGYTTSQWRPGELIREHYYLPTDEKLTTGEITLTLNLLDWDGGPVLEQPLNLAPIWVQSKEPSFDVPSGVDSAGKLSLGAPLRSQPSSSRASQPRISLLGYDLDSAGKPVDTLKVTLYWRADGEPERSYKVFVHVYDQEGDIVGQRDHIPGLGIRPTTSWEPGEVIADRYNVEVSAGLAPGTYSVAVGMYDADSGERVPAFGPDGERLVQDRLLLGEVTIRP